MGFLLRNHRCIRFEVPILQIQVYWSSLSTQLPKRNFANSRSVTFLIISLRLKEFSMQRFSLVMQTKRKNICMYLLRIYKRTTRCHNRGFIKGIFGARWSKWRKLRISSTGWWKRSGKREKWLSLRAIWMPITSSHW